MTKDDGRFAVGDRATPEQSQQAVSAVPGGIPSAEATAQAVMADMLGIPAAEVSPNCTGALLIREALRRVESHQLDVLVALSRATIRSYSHKQRDLKLEVANSDDLTALVTYAGCAAFGGDEQ